MNQICLFVSILFVYILRIYKIIFVYIPLYVNEHILYLLLLIRSGYIMGMLILILVLVE